MKRLDSKKRYVATTGNSSFSGNEDKSRSSSVKSHNSSSSKDIMHSMDTSTIRSKNLKSAIGIEKKFIMSKALSSHIIKPPLHNFSSQVSTPVDSPKRPLIKIKKKTIIKTPKHSNSLSKIVIPISKKSGNLSLMINELDKSYKDARSYVDSKTKENLSKINVLPKIYSGPQGQDPTTPKIHTNLNLSFNNSFNTSFNGSYIMGGHQTGPSSLQSTQKLNEKQLSMSKKSSLIDLNKPTKAADALQLEIMLTNRLKEVTEVGSQMTDKKLAAFTKTFEEIIEKDVNFGSLLSKIKNAYDEYLKSTLATHSERQQVSERKRELSQRKQAELDQKYSRLESSYHLEKSTRLRLEAQCDELKIKEKTQEQELIHKTKQIEELENEVMQLKEDRNNQKKLSQSHRHLMRDISNVINHSAELECTLNQYRDEMEYMHQRENKIMYLLFLLENKGFPVNEVFEKEIKGIPTPRFSEFMQNQQQQQQQQQQLDTSVQDTKMDTSIDNILNSSAMLNESFEPIMASPPPLQKTRPCIVPKLNFENIEEYESSSGEIFVCQTQMDSNNYQQSLKYIKDFYKKHETAYSDLKSLNTEHELSQTINDNQKEEDTYMAIENSISADN